MGLVPFRRRDAPPCAAAACRARSAQTWRGGRRMEAVRSHGQRLHLDVRTVAPVHDPPTYRAAPYRPARAARPFRGTRRPARRACFRAGTSAGARRTRRALDTGCPPRSRLPVGRRRRAPPLGVHRAPGGLPPASPPPPPLLQRPPPPPPPPNLTP